MVKSLSSSLRLLSAVSFFLLLSSSRAEPDPMIESESSSSSSSSLLQHPTISLSVSVGVSQELKGLPFDLLEIIQEAQQQQQQQQQQQKKNGTSSNSSSAVTGTERRERCSYTVSIRTSCSSPRITRDEISLTFGDVYGNEVYAGRLDDPSTGTFERCSTDTFKIVGPCGERKTCYLYLRRRGRDGWTPEWVKVYYRPPAAVTFFYNAPLPNDIWYGFNLCHDGVNEKNNNGKNQLDQTSYLNHHPEKTKMSGSSTFRTIQKM